MHPLTSFTPGVVYPLERLSPTLREAARGSAALSNAQIWLEDLYARGVLNRNHAGYLPLRPPPYSLQEKPPPCRSKLSGADLLGYLDAAYSAHPHLTFVGGLEALRSVPEPGVAAPAASRASAKPPSPKKDRKGGDPPKGLPTAPAPSRSPDPLPSLLSGVGLEVQDPPPQQMLVPDYTMPPETEAQGSVDVRVQEVLRVHEEIVRAQEELEEIFALKIQQIRGLHRKFEETVATFRTHVRLPGPAPEGVVLPPPSPPLPLTPLPPAPSAALTPPVAVVPTTETAPAGRLPEGLQRVNGTSWAVDKETYLRILSLLFGGEVPKDLKRATVVEKVQTTSLPQLQQLLQALSESGVRWDLPPGRKPSRPEVFRWCQFQHPLVLGS